MLKYYRGSIVNIYKVIIIFLFIFVVYNLGQAMRHMFKKDNDPNKMAKSLTWRIGLSVLVFAIILGLIATGKIGVNPSPLQFN